VAQRQAASYTACTVRARGLLHHGGYARRGGRLSRHSRRAFPHIPWVVIGTAPAALGHGGEYRRDIAGIRAARGGNRAQWIEAAAPHLLKREYLEPDWDEEREEVVARERVSFLGLVLSANRVVNYGPIAPEESRRIFAREALVYQRLRRRPDWLLANDTALRDAQQMEERLRTRDLLHGAEAFVEFYDRALPRQVYERPRRWSISPGICLPRNGEP